MSEKLKQEFTFDDAFQGNKKEKAAFFAGATRALFSMGKHLEELHLSGVTDSDTDAQIRARYIEVFNQIVTVSKEQGLIDDFEEKKYQIEEK